MSQASQAQTDESLACGSSSAVAYDLVRPVIGEASVRAGEEITAPGIPGQLSLAVNPQ